MMLFFDNENTYSHARLRDGCLVGFIQPPKVFLGALMEKSLHYRSKRPGSASNSNLRNCEGVDITHTTSI